VLIDSELLIAEVESELRSELGMPISVEEYLHKYVGLSTRSREYTDDLEIFPPNYASLVTKRVRESMQQNLKAMPGAREFLDRLKLDKAIASSSTPEELAFSLKIAGLYDDFAGRIFSVTMVEYPKPLPDIYLYVAAQTGHDPKNCLVIEDSIVGATAARAAGMRTLGFTGASHGDGNSETSLYNVGVEAVFADFYKLPALLDELQIEYK
jgi:HAD superfamily hydrolase (TIGR01509 family)